MLMITDRMDAAMIDGGFVRKKARWRRHTPELPIVVFQEQAGTGGPLYGFTILFGYPHRNPDEWGCFQISQGEACRRRRGHYYDVSTASEREQIEQDFLQFTAPMAARFHSGRELAAALIAGDVPLSWPTRGQTGLVKDVYDVADAHDVAEARMYALTLARTLYSSRRTRSQIRELASFRPGIEEALDVTSPAPPRRRWWRSGR
jgi:hypothetical protein